jgi:hypothetical protein
MRCELTDGVGRCPDEAKFLCASGDFQVVACAYHGDKLKEKGWYRELLIEPAVQSIPDSSAPEA